MHRFLASLALQILRNVEAPDGENSKHPIPPIICDIFLQDNKNDTRTRINGIVDGQGEEDLSQRVLPHVLKGDPVEEAPSGGGQQGEEEGGEPTAAISRPGGRRGQLFEGGGGERSDAETEAAAGKGRYFYDVRNISRLLNTPSPPVVTYIIHATSFLVCFLGTPSPHPLRTSYKYTPKDGGPRADLQGGVEASPLHIADAEAARGRSRPRIEARLERRGGRRPDHARGWVGNVQVDHINKPHKKEYCDPML